MAEIWRGVPVTESLNSKIIQDVGKLKADDIIPTLAIVRLGEHPEDLSYERQALRRADKLGVGIAQILLPQDTDEERVLATIQRLNQDPKIHGVLIFRPLPKHIDEDSICNFLAPEKDIDGITDISAASVFLGKGRGFAPCTPSACIEILKYFGVQLDGKNVVVIGRSPVVGRPLAMMLLKSNATVTICHTHTQNLSEICQQADILIVAVGKAGMVGKDFVSPGQIVIDVGINWDEEKGMFKGDVDMESVSPVVRAITPVPGGVGTVTTTILFEHVVHAAVMRLDDVL